MMTLDGWAQKGHGAALDDHLVGLLSLFYYQVDQSVCWKNVSMGNKCLTYKQNAWFHFFEIIEFIMSGNSPWYKALVSSVMQV